MDRSVPVTGNEDVDLYIRTYYSLLRSSGEVKVQSLEETHAGMNAGMHRDADSPHIDLSAFTYSAMRLPDCIPHIRLILLGQSAEVFARRGYSLKGWTLVKAKARRRKMFFDNDETLGVFINSISDIDDLVPLLTTYQIEWNKMHQKLIQYGIPAKTNATLADYQEALGLNEADFAKLTALWGENTQRNLTNLAHAEKHFALKLLAGSRTDYRRATQGWWEHAMRGFAVPDVHDRPVYFVSSNMHIIPNLLSSYAPLIRQELLDFLHAQNPESLSLEFEKLAKTPNIGAETNLHYYLLRQYLNTAKGKTHIERMQVHELEHGVQSIKQPFNLDVGLQIVEISKLSSEFFDPRLKFSGANWNKLRQSDALIVNIDYPLGMAAYQALSQISANVGELKGVYILGKAASLNGRVGDVLIPNVVHDEHSKNTYLFHNYFSADDVAPFLNYGTVLDHQKAVTVRGTFLQNNEFMHLFYKEGYTDIEMESGPYLSAMYENIYPQRYPVNEIVRLYSHQPYDIGLLHYVSDTPYSKRQSLLSKSLLYFGMDSTYATAVPILRRILSLELAA